MVMDRLLPLSEVESATSLKKSQLYVMMKAGQFPHSVKVAGRRVAWRASEIQSWITERASSQSAGALECNPMGANSHDVH